MRWHGCRRVLASRAELCVVALADLRTHQCTIALKVKGADLRARRAAYEQVLAAGSPSEASWTRGRRSSATRTRIWTLNASETAEHTLQFGEFIARFAHQID